MKNIVAGVFFLMDDAFRAGDYIEAAGTKGMVDHISLRSLRRRHPRGMVNTIPFGDMGIVTNMSGTTLSQNSTFGFAMTPMLKQSEKSLKRK